MTLRIYADFNSVYGTDGEICWCLRYGVEPGRVGRSLDELTEEVKLHANRTVSTSAEAYQNAKRL